MLAYKRTELPQPLASVNQKSILISSVPVSISVVKRIFKNSKHGDCVL